MSTETRIFEAIEAGDLESVRKLASDDPAIGRAQDEQGISAVMQARYHGRTEMVELLLSDELELNFHEAAAMGHRERAAALLGKNPDLVRAWSPDGFTALHFACFFGHPDIAALLLEGGADVEVASRNELGVTPLQSAASGGHVHAAKLLLEAGAEVHPAHPSGFTPLHSAASNGDRDTAELLLRHGADPNRAKDDGKTSIDLAVENGHVEIVALLGKRADG